MTAVDSPALPSTTVRFLELIRFSHTVFALPFALTSALLAWNTPVTNRVGGSGAELPTSVPFSLLSCLGIVLCMVTARSAAMAFNRLVDQSFDAANPRTATRHLVTGSLTQGQVTIFTLASAIAFIMSTLLFLPNRWPLRLSLPILLFLLGYSYTKRYTRFSHIWLGASLMMAPIGAWIAIRGGIATSLFPDTLPAMLLGIAVLLWVAGFDIIYACQDVEFDRSRGLRSIPAALGVPRALHLAAVLHAGMIVVLASLPRVCPQVPLGTIYYTGIAAVTALLIYEHLLVRPDDLTRVNKAFFQVNAVISLGLLTVIAVDVFWR